MANEGIAKKVVFDLNQALSSTQSLLTKAASGQHMGPQQYAAMFGVIESLSKGIHKLAEHVEALEKRLPQQGA